MSNHPNVISKILLEAKAHSDEKEFSKALLSLEKALKIDPKNKSTLTLKVHIGLNNGDRTAAKAALNSLIACDPLNLKYSITLAQLYCDAGEESLAPSVFEPLLLQFTHPDLFFNYAWFLTRAAEYKKAIDNYRKAIDQGLKGPEEAHLNIANIYSTWMFEPEKAKKELIQAVKLKPDYISALYNLGNLEEDSGNRDSAKTYFKNILTLEPNHAKALARIAMASNDNEEAIAICRGLHTMLKNPTLEEDSRVDCYYALGKLQDQQGNYDEAFSCWQSANIINTKLVGRFSKNDFSRTIERLIKFYSIEYCENIQAKNDSKLVFIGGMFRSGSTLIEQILASHPALTAGGELDYFPRKAKQIDALNPSQRAFSATLLDSIGDEYLEYLNSSFPLDTIVTDKRPDNILHIGLIKTIFPNARIIITKRQLLDNCLSIYSYRFGSDMNYACNLTDIAFYNKQINKLVDHWLSLFADTIFVVDYDYLVHDAEKMIADLLGFLGLSWDGRCLDFHRLRNIVNTASVWQVRRPLYSSSSGRWKNYQRYLCEL